MIFYVCKIPANIVFYPHCLNAAYEVEANNVGANVGNIQSDSRSIGCYVVVVLSIVVENAPQVVSKWLSLPFFEDVKFYVHHISCRLPCFGRAESLLYIVPFCPTKVQKISHILVCINIMYVNTYA